MGILVLAVKMRVFVFGSRGADGDDAAFRVAQALEAKLPGVEFVECEDPFALFEEAQKTSACNGKEDAGKGSAGNEKIIVLDAVRGIGFPRVVSISELSGGTRVSLHDFDLAQVLQLIQKTSPKAAESIKIIGVPLNNAREKNVQGAVLGLLKEIAK